MAEHGQHRHSTVSSETLFSSVAELAQFLHRHCIVSIQNTFEHIEVDDRFPAMRLT
jgi:hypothetical protein